MSVLSLLGMASLGSVGALSGAAAIAAAPARWRERLLPLLLAYSAGTMLSAALLGMIPRAVRALPGMQAGLAVLAGLLLFYLLERVQAWHHCHEPGCERRQRRGRLILVGDALHNFVDGVVIAAAFLTSPALGWLATLAVVAHEVPQEMGDFAVLVASGYSRLQALGWNLVSALATLPGALLGWWLLGTAQTLVPWALALSAASFLYIALGDLLPRLHDAADRGVRGQVPALLAGVATIVLVQLQH
jgi:zinc and cadmium transporter